MNVKLLNEIKTHFAGAEHHIIADIYKFEVERLAREQQSDIPEEVDTFDFANLPQHDNTKTFKGINHGTGAVSGTNIFAYMTQLWTQCVRGSNMPSKIIMDPEFWTLYVSNLKPVGFNGFNNTFFEMKFMSATVILDKDMPARTAYFLDSTGTKIDGILKD